MEQLPGDSIGDAGITKLAHTMGLKPITRFGLLARYESVAATWKGRAGRTDRHVLCRAVLPIVARHRKVHGNREPVPIPIRLPLATWRTWATVRRRDHSAGFARFDVCWTTRAGGHG